MPAVVAGDRPGRAVQHERDVAVRAQPDLPAVAAGEEVRPAAAVEQHDRLAAGRRDLGQRRLRLRVQRVVVPAHVDDLHGRQALAVDALAQRQVRQLAPGLRARGRRPADQRRVVVGGPPARDEPRVVARVALVLERRVVLLVDDHEPEVVHRREHRRARPDRHPRLAAAQPQPLVEALALGQPGVQQRHRVAEARLEARDGLRRQRDLGDEHDHAAAALERRLRRAQVDLGLARAGDAVQQVPLARVRCTRSAASCSGVSATSRSAPGCVSGTRRRTRGSIVHQAARLEAPQRRRGPRRPGPAAAPAPRAGCRSAGPARRRCATA